MGVNYSRNTALDYIKNDKSSDYVIFLDDDDWLSDGTLIYCNNVIKNNPNKKWYVSNRAKESGESLTKNRTNKTILYYFFDYLLTKRFSGDVTHIIKSEIATRFHFSKKIKNGEEWTYFIQIPYKFFYYNHNSTFTNGYSNDGLNTSMQKTYLSNTLNLFKEIKNLKMFFILTVRLCLSLFRKYNKR
jgi:glycosyltransferase involved in cell wall biosynthesis